MSKAQIEISITEKQILHAWIDGVETVLEDEDFFITQPAEEYRLALLSLSSKGLVYIPEHILKEALCYITATSLRDILDTSYQADKVLSYYEDLRKYKIFTSIENDIYPLLKPGNIKDITVLENAKEKLDAGLELLEKDRDFKGRIALNFYEHLALHQDTLEELHSSHKETTGDIVLDGLLGKNAITSGLCLLAGDSGSLKSTFCSSLFQNRLVKGLPIATVNTELSKENYMNGLLPSLMKITYDEITNNYTEDNMVDSQNVFEQYEIIKQKFFEQQNGFIFPNNSIDFKTLKKFIRQCRRAYGMKENQLFFICIDLLSMIKEFSTPLKGLTQADSITVGVNELNNILLELNTFAMGTLQLKRSDTKRIETKEDIQKFRHSVSDIKSSGAYNERARTSLLLFNPWNIVHSQPCDDVLKELVPPIIDITVGKTNYSETLGKSAKYAFDAQFKRLIPYTGSDDDII